MELWGWPEAHWTWRKDRPAPHPLGVLSTKLDKVKTLSLLRVKGLKVPHKHAQGERKVNYVYVLLQHSVL